MDAFYRLLKDDWKYTEGVVDGGFAYGADRDITDKPQAPTAGVKMRLSNPTQEAIAVAASSFGFRTTDMSIVVWANTLRATPSDETSQAIVPVEGDKLSVNGVVYIIKRCHRTVYGTQFHCYCWQSQKTPE